MAKLSPALQQVVESACRPLPSALAFAARRWPVFPLAPGTKVPFKGSRGALDATTDQDQIRRWFTEHPDAGIGASMGDDRLAIDIDVNHGGVRADVFPETRTHHSGRGNGNVHLIYKVEPGSLAAKIKPGANVFGPGMDVRSGPGSYIVMPPTPHPDTGLPYRVDDELTEEHVLTDDEVRAIYGYAGRDLPGEPSTATPSNPSEAGSLSELRANPVDEGGRNDWLTKVAGHYAGRLPFDDYCYHVEEANKTCNPPLPADEVGKLMMSIWEREQGKHGHDSEAYQREVNEQARRMRVRRDAQRLIAEEEIADDSGQFINGSDFMFDIPEGTPAVWGRGTEVAWAEGEALMLAAPTGVGKTTLAGQITRARVGLGCGEVLGLPVAPTKSLVLYLAMDRPAQIARSLRRHFSPDERQTLDEKLVIRKGPPPKDVAQHPEVLLELAQTVRADTVIIDSIKDAAVGLSSDEVGAGFNRAVQLLTANDIEVLELHHVRKQGGDGGKPNQLTDVYGSAWLTSGIGSLILLWGEAGDLDVELTHLKHPADRLGPWRLRHDHHAGETTRISGGDPLAILIAAPDGLTATDLSDGMGWDPSDRADKNRARRTLNRLAAQGLAVQTMEQRGTQKATVWRAAPEQTGRIF